MDLLVTGGTGALGRPLVKKPRESGHRAVVLSRKPGAGPDWKQGDLATGAGLAGALKGIEAVIHAGSATTQPQRYRQTDVEGTRRLLEAARKAGVAHFVYVSIVGMEGVKYPYYRYKLAAEAIVKQSPVPWSILRATQFHTLMEIFLRRFSAIPGLLALPYEWKFQPLDTRDVAGLLVEVVDAGPGGLLPDYGGPEVRDFKSIAQAWMRARKSRRRLLNLPMPLQFSRQFALGKLTCPDHRDGKTTWEQYLERRYGEWS